MTKQDAFADVKTFPGSRICERIANRNLLNFIQTFSLIHKIKQDTRILCSSLSLAPQTQIH